MIINIGIAVFYCCFITGKASPIAVPLFMSSLFNILIWLLQDFVPFSMILIWSILIEVLTIFLMKTLSNGKAQLVKSVLIQCILLVFAATLHLLQLIDTNEGTSFVFDNYNLLIEGVIILEILSLGVTMYGDYISDYVKNIRIFIFNNSDLENSN